MKLARASLAAVGLLAAGAILSGCAGADSTSGSMNGMDMGSPTASAGSPAAGDAGTPAPSPYNEADVMFAQMMIPHHAQAIAMSDLILSKNGVPRPVLDLARQIKAAQGPEITQMTAWLQTWGADVPATTGSMEGMDMGASTNGGMSQRDMDALKQATGAQAGKLFLQQMIVHHQGALAMAKQEQVGGQDPEAKALAAKIIAAQEQEIVTMQNLLSAS